MRTRSLVGWEPARDYGGGAARIAASLAATLRRTSSSRVEVYVRTMHDCGPKNVLTLPVISR
jgi:hypothetical protein